MAGSKAAQTLLAVMPIVGIGVGGVIVFFYLLWKHREISLMIKTGAYHRHEIDVLTYSLFASTTLISTGLALTVIFAAIDGLSYALLGGAIPLSLGAGLLLFYWIRSNKK